MTGCIASSDTNDRYTKFLLKTSFVIKTAFCCPMRWSYMTGIAHCAVPGMKCVVLNSPKLSSLQWWYRPNVCDQSMTWEMGGLTHQGSCAVAVLQALCHCSSRVFGNALQSPQRTIYARLLWRWNSSCYHFSESGRLWHAAATKMATHHDRHQLDNCTIQISRWGESGSRRKSIHP